MIVFSGNSMLLFQVVDVLESLRKHNKEKVILIANQSTEEFFKDNPCVKEIFIIPNKFSLKIAVKLYRFVRKHAKDFPTNNHVILDIYPTLYSVIIKNALRSNKYFKEESNYYLELEKDNSYLSFYDQINALLSSAHVEFIDNIHSQQTKSKPIDLPWLNGDISAYHVQNQEDYFCVLPNIDEFFPNQVIPNESLKGMDIKKLAISVIQIYMDTGLKPIFLGNFKNIEQIAEYQDIILDYCPMADIYFNVLDSKQIITIGKYAKFILGNLNNLTMILGGLGQNVTVVCESNLMTSIYKPTGYNIRIIITQNIDIIPTTSLLNNMAYVKSLEFPHTSEDSYDESDEEEDEEQYYESDYEEYESAYGESAESESAESESEESESEDQEEDEDDDKEKN